MWMDYVNIGKQKVGKMKIKTELTSNTKGVQVKTPEFYFKMGAQAMQSRLTALIVISGDIKLAQKILSCDLPEFQEPEIMEIEDEQENFKSD